MGTRVLSVLVVVAALFYAWGPVMVSGYGSTMMNAKERMNLAAGDAKLKANEAMQDAKETSESWAEWVQDKITGGLGLRHDNAKMAAEEMKERAADIATKTKEKMSDAASGMADVASQKSGGAKEILKDKAGEAKDVLKKKASDVQGKMADGADHASDTAERAYHGAQQRMGKAYETARDTMTENAKTGYETAKEKVSQATGDMGASMNQKVEEL